MGAGVTGRGWKRLAAAVLVACCAAVPAAAERTFVDVQVNTRTVRLGEAFRLVVTAGTREGAVRLPGARVRWPDCRTLDYRERDVSVRHEGFHAVQGEYRLAAFALDRVHIPALPVYFVWADGTSITASTPPLTLEVPSQDPQGVQLRPFRPPVRPGRLWPWIATLLAAAGIAAWFRRRWRGGKARRKAPEPPPENEALARLETLGRSRIVAEGRLGEYFTVLSRILRRYAARRYRLNALELPLTRLLEELAARGVADNVRRELEEILAQADLVKFARAEVDFPEIGGVQRRALTWIRATRRAAKDPEGEHDA